MIEYLALILINRLLEKATTHLIDIEKSETHLIWAVSLCDNPIVYYILSKYYVDISDHINVSQFVNDNTVA